MTKTWVQMVVRKENGHLNCEQSHHTSDYIKNEVLVKCCEDLFARAGRTVERALRDSGYHAEDLADIILVGGSSKMPVVPYFLTSFMGRKPTLAGSPDEIVAHGAGIYAGIKERKEDLKDILLTDICPFTLGVEVNNRSGDRRSIFSPVIERNSVLPSANTQRYTNVYDGQSKVVLRVYQGEEYYCEDNLFLGELELPIQPMPAGHACIRVTFSYDINGILVVDACEGEEKNTAQKVFISQNLRLSKQEIDAKIKELETYKNRNGRNVHSDLLLARGKRVFAETTGLNRQHIGELLRQYERAFADGDRENGVRLQKMLEDFLEQFEK